LESVTTPRSIMRSGFTKFVFKTGQVGEREGEKEITLVLLALSCMKLDIHHLHTRLLSDGSNKLS
jgi:hypothetical protein